VAILILLGNELGTFLAMHATPEQATCGTEHVEASARDHRADHRPPRPGTRFLASGNRACCHLGSFFGVAF
jgi:hypothetical protein